VAGFSVLWRVKGMSDRYLSYYYCPNCSIPYRCITFTRPGKLGVSLQKGTAPMSYHCVHCGTKVIQPGSFANLMIALLIILIVMICFWLRPIGHWTAVLVVQTLLGTGRLLLVQSSLSSSQKCKHIYDRWVMQHGNDPDKWPDATQPE